MKTILKNTRKYMDIAMKVRKVYQDGEMSNHVQYKIAFVIIAKALKELSVDMEGLELYNFTPVKNEFGEIISYDEDIDTERYEMEVCARKYYDIVLQRLGWNVKHYDIDSYSVLEYGIWGDDGMEDYDGVAAFGKGVGNLDSLMWSLAEYANEYGTGVSNLTYTSNSRLYDYYKFIERKDRTIPVELESCIKECIECIQSPYKNIYDEELVQCGIVNDREFGIGSFECEFYSIGENVDILNYDLSNLIVFAVLNILLTEAEAYY